MLGRVLIITGAGISAESGIPTFRGKDGYWRNLDPTKLATPEAFARDPSLVWEWYRERRQRIRCAQPNAAHEAIVKLSKHAEDFLLVTQNVDDLHARAEWNGNRLPPEKIVQIHGDIFSTRCSRCALAYHEEEQDEPHEHEGEGASAVPFGVRRHVAALTARTRPRTPKCPQCGALMRPAVVWFGERLSAAKIDVVERYLNRGPCDLVLVIGTTALFGYIIDWSVRGRGQLIEINPTETSLSGYVTKLIREPAGIALPRLVDQLIAHR